MAGPCFHGAVGRQGRVNNTNSAMRLRNADSETRTHALEDSISIGLLQ
jgi:hypothetical protein